MNPDSTLWAKRMKQSFENAGETSATQAQTALGTIAAMKGTAIKHKRPILEAELPLDGSRFEELVSPVVRSPVFAIRPRPRRVFRLEEYEVSEMSTSKVDRRNRLRQRTYFLDAIRDRHLSHGEIVRAAIAEKKNILAAGYTNRLFGILALIEFAWTGSADTLALLQAMQGLARCGLSPDGQRHCIRALHFHTSLSDRTQASR